MDGYLLADKPTGWTSHDVVAKVRSILKTEIGRKIKVGHTGTLDPAATGLLILVIGAYTKRAAGFAKLDKTYEVELTLGATSSTGDAEGKITPHQVRPDGPKKDEITPHRVVPGERPSQVTVERVLEQFVGRIRQVPPAYSAVKVGGQRAYWLARQGKVVETKSREVKIYSIDDIKYKYPSLSFKTKVSSGTYIRSLAEDLGNRLETGAYVSKLRRTAVGAYKIENAKVIDKITISDIISS